MKQEEMRNNPEMIPEQPPAPTDNDIAQAQAEAVVAQIARQDKIQKDVAESQQFRQFQQTMTERAPAIGEEQVRAATQRLMKYKQGKSSVDQRIIDNEQFFKLRHWESKGSKIKPTAWLWNVIQSKHADMMDGYPEPNILAKAEDDKQEAEMLKSIVPVVFESNGFHNTYNKCSWYKLIKGTGCYGVFWDSSKLNGQGDIAVEKIDILNLFWESGITDIQDSREVFLTDLVDKEQIMSQYPQTRDRLSSGGIINSKKYVYDDSVDTEDKIVVIDWYYKKYVNGKTVLHYCKYVDNIVLFASENETEMPTAPVTDPMTGQPIMDDNGQPFMKPTGLSMSERGWYDHGMYPFVLDPLFSVEGSPCGYSYIDICKSTQDDIDLLNHSIINNAQLSARPRFFVRGDGSINEEEFKDFSKDIVHVEGASVGEDSVRLIAVPQIPGNAINVLENKIEELKETSSNRDVNNGSSSQGITAASAIAALQESAGKTSRDNLSNSYEASKEITYQVIELIRQFYNTQRQFRITGKDGQQQYVSYSNAGIRPQNQGQMYGIDMGYRIPQFDIEVNAQKATMYTKMSQNEFALQLYQAGILSPDNADQSLAVLDLMDFNHKEDVIAKVQMYQNLQKINQQLLGIAMSLATQYNPQIAQQLSMDFGMGGEAPAGQQGGAPVPQSPGGADIGGSGGSLVDKARKQAQNATQVG